MNIITIPNTNKSNTHRKFDSLSLDLEGDVA